MVMKKLLFIIPFFILSCNKKETYCVQVTIDYKNNYFNDTIEKGCGVDNVKNTEMMYGEDVWNKTIVSPVNYNNQIVDTIYMTYKKVK